MNIDTGGPAFPTREKIGEEFNDATGNYRDVFGTFGGMTLRDYFAAQVIGSLTSMPTRHECDTEQDACYAYRVADAMLAERAK